MEGIKNQLDDLFNIVGKHYEVISYEKNRRAELAGRRGINLPIEPPSNYEIKLGVQLELLTELLTALAPFKERILKLKDHDIK